MQQMMLDVMIQMMPYMKPLVYIGAALLIIGVLMALIALVSGSGSALARFAASSGSALARFAASGLIVLGVFFLACQVAGAFLGAKPSINFGDPAKFEFILYPFWQIGGVLLVVGLIVRMLSAVGARRAGRA